MIVVNRGVVNSISTEIVGVSGDAPLLLVLKSKEIKEKYYHKLTPSIGDRFTTLTIKEGANYPRTDTDNGEMSLISSTYIYELFIGSELDYEPHSEALKIGLLKTI